MTLETQAPARDVLDQLTQQVTELVEHQVGRLSYLRVACPEHLADAVARDLPETLTALGLDFVDIDVEPGARAPFIQTSRFDAGWS